MNRASRRLRRLRVGLCASGGVLVQLVGDEVGLEVLEREDLVPVHPPDDVAGHEEPEYHTVCKKQNEKPIFKSDCLATLSLTLCQWFSNRLVIL